MTAPRTTTPTIILQDKDAVVQEVMRLLSTKQTTPQRWVCEVCGMIHTGVLPDACDSCGLATDLVQHPVEHREMNSRW